MAAVLARFPLTEQAAPDPGEAPTSGPRVAVLGVGIMGSAMARNLIAAGVPTTVWDRTPAVAGQLETAGARVATTAAEAVRDAEVVITMLPTADVVANLVFDGGISEAFAPGAVWAQMGTVGAAETGELVRRLAAARPDVRYVDAPVSGSKGPAESGQLLILASGPSSARSLVEPVFDVLGRRTMWLGDAGRGSQLKLVVNAYMSVLVEGVAESLALARHLGLDPTTLADVIGGGPLGAPIAEAKLHKMETGDHAPEFPLEWALKDIDLALASAGGLSLPALDALSHQWHSAVDAGHGRQDVSAAVLALGSEDGGSIGG